MTRRELRNKLESEYRWDDYIRLLADYKSWLKKKGLSERITCDYIPVSENDLMGFVFRFNDDESYNDVLPNNDLKVLAKRVISDGDWSVDDELFNVTADPKTKRNGIAHFLPQVYRGNIGNHRAIIGRICIRSDRGCWYFRTGDGKAIFGMIGLNWHNSAGFFNTSLGCVINEDENRWREVEKPMLKRVNNTQNIPCAIVAHEFTLEYFK
ncbi:MAG TPA: hypothetical protein PKD94_04580 [Ignavibacteria bacterium]|nr:hypothetical protein [Ignavibacteria bacterium]